MNNTDLARRSRKGAIADNRAGAGRRYASIDAAAIYYGVGHRLIRKLVANGTLTGFQLPGSKLIRIDLDELDRLAADGQ
ncbi:MAG: hypothetical protein QM779_08160 [Propionicimonas sp.]|uniref:hypothetical protein n=1 Tax=Propionicimonas sp. TaxID=1955623 RepID=UPI003D0A0DAA